MQLALHLMEFPNSFDDMIALLASLLFLLFAAAAAAKRFTTKSSSTQTNLQLPPGPWKLPILGNLHNLIFSSSLLHRRLHRLALKHGPLFPLKLGQISIILISSPELAKQVLKDHDLTFAQRAPLLFPALIFYDCSDVLFAPYGDYWRQVRKICQMELLSPNRVKSFASIRSQEVSNLIESIHSSSAVAPGRKRPSSVNLTRLIFQMSSGVTSRAAFGRKYKDQEALMSLTIDIMKLASGLGLADMFPSCGEMFKAMTKLLNPKLKRVIREADRIVEDILSDHRKKKQRNSLDDEREDLVDVLLQMQRSGDLEVPLTDNDIKAVLLDMLVAGSMTSSATVGWIMSEIVKDPSAMKRAQDEVRRVFNTKEKYTNEETAIQDLHFLKCCIKEAIRLHPPVALIVRESRTSCKISGYDIPSNTIVSINTWVTCRDPRYWNDADKFVPERFLYGNCVNYVDMDHFEFTPFGAGRRRCPGVSFAMANIELPVAKLLYHFDWELPDGKRNQDLDMTESFGVTVRRRNDLVLVPIPHYPTFTK